MMTFEQARDGFVAELKTLGCDVCWDQHPTTIRDAAGTDTGVCVGMAPFGAAGWWSFRLHPERAPMVLVHSEPDGVAKALAKCGIRTH